MYKIELGTYWSDTPSCWKNFYGPMSGGIESRQFKDGIKEYNAIYVNLNRQIGYLEFETEEDAVAFRLKWD